MVFILARTVATLFTLASLESLMSLHEVGLILTGDPDPALKHYLKEHPNLLTLQSGSNPKELYDTLTTSEIECPLVFCVKEGSLVLKRLDQGIVPESHPATYGCSRKYMYAGKLNKDRSYLLLKIKAKQEMGDSLMHFWLDRPWQALPYVYHNGKVWSDDPLVSCMMRGADYVKHAWYGTQAHVLDYYDQVSNPESSVELCYSAPFEYYLPYADQLRSYLTDECYAAIQRNGRRSEFSAPLRRLVAPYHVYYDQLANGG